MTEWVTSLAIKAGIAVFAMVIGPAITAFVRKRIADVPPKYAPVVSLVVGAILAAFDPETGAKAAVDGAVAQKMLDHVPARMLDQPPVGADHSRPDVQG